MERIILQNYQVRHIKIPIINLLNSYSKKKINHKVIYYWVVNQEIINGLSLNDFKLIKRNFYNI